MSKRIANIGLMTALAMIFSYVEAMLPINFGIPGVKIGIANLVVVSGVYILNIKDVWMISMIRIFLMGLVRQQLPGPFQQPGADRRRQGQL